MQIDTHLSRVHEQLVAAAALGDDRTREIAEALTTAAIPAVRLALLAALSEIADEVTAALLDHPGAPAVAVRIDGDEIAVDVRAVAPAMAGEAPPVRPSDAEMSARISLRLGDCLKADIDAAAEREGISVNTWLVRAAAGALRPGAPDTSQGAAGRGRRRETQHVSGWING
jgi:uncharacterized protein (DUF1778 family)